MSMANTLTGAQLDALWDATWAAREAREQHEGVPGIPEEFWGEEEPPEERSPVLEQNGTSKEACSDVCDMCQEEIAGTAYILPQWMGGDVLCEACADDPDTLLYYFGKLDVGSMQEALGMEAEEI